MKPADILFHVVSVGTLVAPMAFFFAVVCAWVWPDGQCARAFDYILHAIFAITG